MTKDYMMALYTRFCDSFMPTEKEKQLEQQLKDQLTKAQRKTVAPSDGLPKYGDR